MGIVTNADVSDILTSFLLDMHIKVGLLDSTRVLFLRIFFSFETHDMFCNEYIPKALQSALFHMFSIVIVQTIIVLLRYDDFSNVSIFLVQLLFICLSFFPFSHPRNIYLIPFIIR